MGETVLDAKGVDALAKLPSLDQLRAKLIGLLQAPATRIAGVRPGAGRPTRPRLLRLRRQGRGLTLSTHSPPKEP